MRAGGTDQGRNINIEERGDALEVDESEQAREQARRRVVLDASVHVDRIQHHMWLLWRGLLAAHPSTALRLRQGLNSQTEHELLVKILSESVQEVGVGAERLVFVRKLPKDQHLARLATAHLFLDSDAYSAHSTVNVTSSHPPTHPPTHTHTHTHIQALDALWAGLPLLTFGARTFASRAPSSFLSALGLPQLIARNQVLVLVHVSVSGSCVRWSWVRA